jgi:hypothetical protein
MISRRTLWALLPLFILGCSDDSTAPPAPTPLTPDQQTIANVRTIRDALETYAAAHDGIYGEYNLPALEQLGLLKNAYTGEIEPSRIRAMFPGQIGLEGYECDGTVYGYRITGYGKDKMLITLQALSNVPADVRSKHDATVANAFLVFDAAMRFAATNNGVFSSDVNGDVNQDGKTLVELLPNSEFLTNPYENAKTEPQDGNGLGIAGAIGYLGVDMIGQGDVNSFIMESYGCELNVILTLVPYSQYGEMIWGGAYTLRTAVEVFAKASGHYPHNLDAETTPAGKTVLDLFSQWTNGHVPYILNPYNQDHYVPTLGIATGKFTIGYEPIETSGVVTDYVITGRTINEIVRLGPKPIP